VHLSFDSGAEEAELTTGWYLGLFLNGFFISCCLTDAEAPSKLSLALLAIHSHTATQTDLMDRSAHFAHFSVTGVIIIF
jgi:hypothetical protein